jgi:hypothetical protein
MPVKSFEPLNPNADITTTRTFLHEVVPMTGAIISGTYGVFTAENNVKNYSHGQFQSVYDYPVLSSSANHIFDITMGYDESSALSHSNSTQNSKKINMYNQMSQLLLGYTGSTNTVRVFESDLVLDQTGSMKEVYFVNFSRLLTKDQIKKGSVEIKLGRGAMRGTAGNAGCAFNAVTGSGGNEKDAFVITLTDASASVDDTGTLNTLGGDYGVLYDAGGASSTDTGIGKGIIFYQAGIMVLTASIFSSSNGNLDAFWKYEGNTWSAIQTMMTGAISSSCDALRQRIQSISFNRKEINSTIYFCRVPHNKFNYSTNPTYITGSKLRVKNNAVDDPVSYITTVGLYSSNNELLAVAKLSEPLKKTPSNEMTLRVRLDY